MLNDENEQYAKVLDPLRRRTWRRKEGIVPIGGTKRACKETEQRHPGSFPPITAELWGTIFSCNSEALPLRLVVVLSSMISAVPQLIIPSARLEGHLTLLGRHNSRAHIAALPSYPTLALRGTGIGSDKRADSRPLSKSVLS